MSRRNVVAAIALPIALLELAAMPAAFAQTPVAQAASAAASGAAKAAPETVTITATRGVATPIARAAATVSVVTGQDIEERNAKDVKDALRYEPGVEVRRQAYRPAGITGVSGRGGNEGINIRGLEGNQVLMLQDGVALPQSFSFGSGSAGRGDYLDTELYERIEILQGPTSAQYGSDGLTGAVNFVTRDPADLLVSGKASYFGLRSSYDSTDRSFGEGATAAFDAGAVQGLVMLDTRHGHATDNKGGSDTLGATRSRPDPLKYDNQTVFAKLVWAATPNDTFKLTAQALANANTADGLSQLSGGYTWSGYTATGYVTGNRVTSDSLKLDWLHKDAANPWWQSVQASVYYRDAATRQELAIAGTNSAGTSATRSRVNHYGDELAGASVVANSLVAQGDLRHQFTYGLDASVARYRTSSSAGSEWTSVTSGYPEVFPKTTETVVGVFAQDEVRWNALSVAPGLRFDAYRMTPHADATYTGASSGSTQPVSTSSDHALSPRLSVLYEVAPAFVPYVQYAHGFRAPSAYQVNSYYNPVGSYGLYYQQIGNPDLKPETSNSFELGLRGRVDLGRGSVRYSAAAFTGQYHGFIDTKVIGGSTSSATDPYTVQYVNYAKASISGVEAKAEWNVDGALTIKGGVAKIRGTETGDDGRTGLDSVPPLSLALGASYRLGERWFAGVDVTHNAAKKKADLADATEFATPAYTLVDLHAGFNVTPRLRLTAGVDNLFDRKYWRWNDVRGVAATETSAKLDALTAPGRNVNLGMKVEF